MKILRIVITGEEPPHYTISNAFQKKFEVVDTLFWDDFQDLVYLNEVIKARVQAHKYDAVFMQIQGHGIISLKTAEIMAKNVPVVFNWTGDVREDIEWYKEISPYVVTLFTNMTDVKTIRSIGSRADYLQTGYDHKYYSVYDEEKIKSAFIEMSYDYKLYKGRYNNIAFCGNYYRDMNFPLTSFRVESALLLKRHYPENFNLYGSNWIDAGIKSEGIANNTKEALLYNVTSLALSISHFNYSRYFSDRLLRELACGCCVLSHRFEDCELEFQDNKQIVYWDTHQDLLEKIDFYMKNPEEARRIGNEAAKYVAENYSWDKFVDGIITLIDKYKL